MLTHLFIDFDNTMMATEDYALPTLIARFNRLYGVAIPAPLTIETFKRQFHGQARETLCANLGQHFGIQVNCADLYAGREWEMMQTLQRVDGGIAMAEGLVPCLGDLAKTHGILPALVSNNPIQRALAAMRFAANGQGNALAALLGTRFFEADELQKPKPDVYLRALAQTGAAPAQSCAVEDSVAGTTAAVSAGLTVFGFTGFAADRTTADRHLRAAGCADTFQDWGVFAALLQKHGLIS